MKKRLVMEEIENFNMGFVNKEQDIVYKLAPAADLKPLEALYISLIFFRAAIRPTQEDIIGKLEELGLIKHFKASAYTPPPKPEPKTT